MIHSGSRPLASATHLTLGPLGYTVVVLCFGVPAALDLQVWLLQMLQQFIHEVDIGVGQLIALNATT